MTPLNQLRLVAFLEGLSFVVLVFIAVPLKHFAGLPAPVRIVGMTHGVFFLLFLISLFRAASEHEWPLKRSVIAFASSLLPFGTFVFDRSLRAEIDAQSAPR